MHQISQADQHAVARQRMKPLETIFSCHAVAKPPFKTNTLSNRSSPTYSHPSAVCSVLLSGPWGKKVHNFWAQWQFNMSQTPQEIVRSGCLARTFLLPEAECPPPGLVFHFHASICRWIQSIYLYVYIHTCMHMGGCRNYGLFLGPLNTRCRIILRTQKRTIDLTTTYIQM